MIRPIVTTGALVGVGVEATGLGAESLVGVETTGLGAESLAVLFSTPRGVRGADLRTGCEDRTQSSSAKVGS